MSASHSPNPVIDARVLMDRALEAEKGIRIRFDTSGAAQRMRQRCHYLVSRERLMTIKAFPSDDPRHGATAYDLLQMWREDESGNRFPGAPRRSRSEPMDSGNWLVIQKLDKLDFQIEDI